MTGTDIHIPTLRTERLVLRAPRASDLDSYAEFCASDRARFVGGPFGRAEAFSKLCALVGHWLFLGYGRWIVADAASDVPLGIVGLMFPEDWPEPEIAWTVFAEGEGRGLAFEAASISRAYAYGTLGWSTVVSCVSKDNIRSRALAERMGATRDGSFDHPEYGPLEIWRHAAPELVA